MIKHSGAGANLTIRDLCFRKSGLKCLEVTHWLSQGDSASLVGQRQTLKPKQAEQWIRKPLLGSGTTLKDLCLHRSTKIPY